MSDCTCEPRNPRSHHVDVKRIGFLQWAWKASVYHRDLIETVKTGNGSELTKRRAERAGAAWADDDMLDAPFKRVAEDKWRRTDRVTAG